MKRTLIVAAVLLVAAACASEEEKAKETPLGKAYTSCTTDGTKNAADDRMASLELADQGHTLIIETTGEDDTDGFLSYICVVDELDTSERVTSSIETTTSMMGRQRSSDGEMEYEYSYHPDNGLYVLITDGVE